MARVSWNIQGKVLYVGIEDSGRKHEWKISPSSPKKAEVLREIADVLDPPPRSASQRRRRRIEQEEWEEDDEEEDPRPRRAPSRAQEPPRQVRTPYPPVDPRGEFSGRQRPGYELVDHSRGKLPDGTPILTPVPDDPAEAESMARLSRVAHERAQAHARAALEDGDDLPLPEIEARPREVRRSQALDPVGNPFLPPPPAETPGITGAVQVRKRPKLGDPGYRYRDTR